MFSSRVPPSMPLFGNKNHVAQQVALNQAGKGLDVEDKRFDAFKAYTKTMIQNGNQRINKGMQGARNPYS